MTDQAPKKSNRGGKRPGAGRKPKGYVKPQTVAGIDLAAALSAPVPDEIDAVAQRHAQVAIAAFVKQLTHGASETQKVTAAKAILDRGYGKPAVEIGGDASMPLPFMMAPSSGPTVSTEVKTEARKYANLAVEVLRAIADHGHTEAARISAANALLDRGLGTVGKARMPDEQRDQPIGKKEQAQRAAAAANTGRYATPSPPSRPH